MSKLFSNVGDYFPEFRAYCKHNSVDGCVKDMTQAKEKGKILIKFIEKAVTSDHKDDKRVKELIEGAFQKLQSIGRVKKLAEKTINQVNKLLSKDVKSSDKDEKQSKSEKKTKSQASSSSSSSNSSSSSKVNPVHNQRQSRLVGKISNYVLTEILSFAVKYDTQSLQAGNIFSTCKYFKALEHPFIERTGKDKMVGAIVRNLLLQNKAPSPQAFKFPNLTITHLSLEGNRAPSLIEPMMQKLVRCFPDLTELNLKNSFLNLEKSEIFVFYEHFDDEYITRDDYRIVPAPGKVLSPLAQLKNLRVLNVDDNHDLSYEFYTISRDEHIDVSRDHEIVVDTSIVFPKLESLSLLNCSSVQCCTSVMRPILNAIAVGKLMPSLTSLNCSKKGIDFSDHDWFGKLQSVEWALGKLRLKVLHLSNHYVSPDRLDLLINNARFERLELVNCNLSADLLGRLVKIPTLQYLNVRNNRDLREEDIANAKEDNPQLIIES